MEIPRINIIDRNHIKNHEELEVTTMQWDDERDWVFSPASLGIWSNRCWGEGEC